MARHQAPAPAEFARLVSGAIDRELGAQRWSGRRFADILGKSEGYVRERRTGKYEWSLNDVEALCEAIGMQPDFFIARIEADEAFRARFEGRAPAAIAERGEYVEGPRVDVGALDEDQLKKHYDLAASDDDSADRLDPDQT